MYPDTFVYPCTRIISPICIIFRTKHAVIDLINIKSLEEYLQELEAERTDRQNKPELQTFSTLLENVKSMDQKIRKSGPPDMAFTVQ